MSSAPLNIPAPPVSDKRARTRERLIEAAAQAIAEKGFHSVTLDQIAARAGLTKGAIYDNFESKEQLFFEVVAANPSELPFPGLDKNVPLAERVKALAKAVVENGDRASRLAPIQAEFLLYSLSRPEMRVQMGQWLEQGFAIERENLARNFSADELPVAPDRFVILLEALLPGLMFLKAQAPHLITDEVVADILNGLFAKA